MDRRIVELLLLKRGVKLICKELHVGKDRVREVRSQAKQHGYLEGGRVLPMPPEALFPRLVGLRAQKAAKFHPYGATRFH